jgi:MFS family permease
VLGTNIRRVWTILGVCWGCISIRSLSPVLDLVSSLPDTLLHELTDRGQNVATILVGRWFQGLSGCIGATVVAGTVSDLYPPAQ